MNDFCYVFLYKSRACTKLKVKIEFLRELSAGTNHGYTVYTTSTLLPLLEAAASNYFEELLPRIYYVKCGFYSKAASINGNFIEIITNVATPISTILTYLTFNSIGI